MIDTVRIIKDNHAGYATINKSDFDPAKHQLYDISSDAESETTPKPRGRPRRE